MEERLVLSVSPLSVLPEYNGFFDDRESSVAFVASLDQNITPEGYNAHDWEKIEAAKAANGLLDHHVTWEEIDGEMRLTRINTNDSSLKGDLNLSGCTTLKHLYCYNNQLTSLNVSGCTSLEILVSFNNRLTSLDVSGCTALLELDCGNNPLTTLDLSDIVALEHLDCWRNPLTVLDVSANTSLKFLNCSENQLTALDISRNTALNTLYCGSNQLAVLNVSGLAALEHLGCNNNQLTSLDVSGNTALGLLDCRNNQLMSLVVSDNSMLWSLDCSNNRLTSLDVSGNTALGHLNCSDNQLTSLNISGCTLLMGLNCSNNQLTSLDVSASTQLWHLYCSGNQMTFSTLPLITLPPIWYKWMIGTWPITEEHSFTEEYYVHDRYVYAPQGDVAIASSLEHGSTLDLSSEYLIDGIRTVYTWYYADGSKVPENLYTETDGQFVLTGFNDGITLYCEMTNERFPQLTLKTTFVAIGTESPTYEVSGPAAEELFARTMTYWDFSAATSSSNAIMDWEIDWGDGSETTQIPGGPRDRISVTHFFREAGTYTITVKTTGLNGTVTVVSIGTYTVKERAGEPLRLQEEPPVVLYAGASHWTSESRFAFAESNVLGIAEIDLYYRVEGEHLPASLDFFAENKPREETIVDRLVRDSNFLEETFQPFDEWTMPLAMASLRL